MFLGLMDMTRRTHSKRDKSPYHLDTPTLRKNWVQQFLQESMRAIRGQGFKQDASHRTKPPRWPSQEHTPLQGIGLLLPLEPRIMFDGAALLTGAEIVQDQITQDHNLQEISTPPEPESLANPFTDSINLQSALSTVTAPTDRQEIVFIDTNVDDYQTLLLGIDSSVETVLLDPEQDGIERIARILGERSDIDAIHIISHGNQGELRLGTGLLNLASMQSEYIDELATINQALTHEADFLIYGCNFGEGAAGNEATSLLAKLTGADIAASNDLTGTVGLSGDWELEVNTGTIETSIAINAQSQENWHSLLAPLVTTGEFVVNDASGNDEQTSGRFRGADRAVDIASNGDYVVVWTDETTSSSVHAKVFDKNGNEKVAEFQVNIGGGNNQWANVAMDDSGNFVVTWTQFSEVFMRRFQADGTAIDAGDVQVNTLTNNFQQNPSISMNGGGDFVIAWETEVGANAGIFVRQGSFAGGLIGSDITVDAGAGLVNPSVDINDAGKFVVVWQKGNEPHAQRFAADGSTRGSQIDIDPILSATLEQHAVVAVQSSGDFVVAYRTEFTGLEGVYMWRYRDDGTSYGLETKVSLGTSHVSPSISMDSSDNYIIVYEGDGDGSGKGVFGRKYDSGGTAQGAQFQINQTTANAQDRASVAMLNQDDFVVIWTGNDGSQTDVFARQYASNNPPFFSALDNTPTFTEGGPPVVLDDNATIADAELDAANNYNGATLTLIRNGGANVEDLFDGSGMLSALTEGGNLTLGGTTIGTITTNSGGTLILTFNSNATTARVNTTLQLLTYANSSDTPPTSVQIDFTVNDGNTGGQGNGGALTDTGSITVTINAINDLPTATPDTYTINEDTTLTTEPDWFALGWQSRQRLTFNNTTQTENLIDFPVLVKLDAGNIDYTKVQNAGEDLRFVDTDGTELAYEIESWNESGTSYIWVKVPQIDGASGTDYIWMYYDNASATDNQNAAGVWSNNFEALSHLHDDFTDSTGNAHNGINSGSLDINGNIGDGQSFDGVDDRIDISSGAGIDNLFTGGATVSAWINPSSWGGGGFGRIFDKGDATSVNNGWALQVENTGNRLIFELGFSGNAGRWRSSINSIALNTWQLVTLTYDSSSDANDPTIYVNGMPVSITESDAPGGTANSDVGLDLAIGNRSGSTDRTFQGIIDEVRLETGTRSADWINAQYLSMTDAFVTFAASEGPGGVLTNDTDADNDPLTASQVGADPANAQSFILNPDGSFSYTPVANFTGIDTFTYKVNDGTVDGNTVTVTINVNPINDAPIVATNTGDTVNEGSPGNVLTTAMLNEGDPDDAGPGLTYTVTAVTTNGTLRLSGTALGLNDTFTQDDIDNNRVTYDHNGTETTTDNFNFSLADGGEDGAVPATGMFNFTVNSLNDPPAFINLDNTPIFTEGGAPVVLDTNATIADPELDAANNYSGATLTLVRNGGTNAEDLFDGSGSLSSLIESGNLVISGTTIGTVTTNSGGTLVLTLNSNATTALVNSTLQQITYANSSVFPPASVQIDYTISDGNTGSQGSGGAMNGTGSITVIINAINIPPVAMSDSFTVDEGSTSTLNLTNNDTDADDGLDLTSITIVAGPTNGTITQINTDGTVEYAHNGSETLTDSFTYTIRDVAGSVSNTATVNLTITPQNDAPSITSNGGGSSATATVLVGNTTVTTVSAIDPEGTPLTYSITGGADAAQFMIDATTGALTFTTAPDLQAPADADADNVYEVTVQTSDGILTDTQTIAVTVSDLPLVVLPPPPEPSPESSPPSDERDTQEEVSGTGGFFATGNQGVGFGHGSTLSKQNQKDSGSFNKSRGPDAETLQTLNGARGRGATANELSSLLQLPFKTIDFKHEIQALLNPASGLLNSLDQARDTLKNISETEQMYVVSSLAASTGLSVGYVIWLLRSGVLLTALLSTVPAWQFVNPLLILDAPARKRRKKGTKNQSLSEEDSLETMFEKPAATPEPPERKTGLPRQSR